jgi:TatD DNase family protein
MITVAENVADAETALGLIRTHPNVFLVAGVHPHRAAKCTTDEIAALRTIQEGQGAAAGLGQRVVAVGETGLDFHYDFSPRDQQEEVFRQHLELAVAVSKPVVIHARESEERVCEILAEYPALAGRVVFHCYSGDPALTRRALDLGCWFSFTGVVTFKNAATIRESARLVPADRIMIETDAPYLSPEPVRKIRPNEPALVVHTARFLAELRGRTLETFAAATTANARRFFSLPEETQS